MATCGHCKKEGLSLDEIRAHYVEAMNTPGGVYKLTGENSLHSLVVARVDVTDGMWRTEDGDIYKVQWNLAKTHLYGKKVVAVAPGDVEFVYTPGVVALLQRENAHKMTLDEAKEFGALYGTCCVCGRTLTNEASIEAGIGPVCAGKLA